MKPYYQDDLVTIYHGDCREVMLDVEADVVVTDPPYGVGMTAFDDDFRVGCQGVNSAPGVRAAVFMSPRRVIDLVNAMESWDFGRLLWMHKTADIAAPWHGWSMNSEAIVIATRHAEPWPPARGYRTDVYSVGPWERSGHPNGKPVAVVTDLVKRLLGIGDDVVLDPFMGSGTTLVAAKNLNVRAVGIEIEEKYCEIAAHRCSQGVLGLSA